MSKPPALVVGTEFGCRIHIPALRAAGFDVVGLVGTDAARTKRRAETNGVSLAFTDLDDAIARTRAKVVTVATPPHTHGPLTMLAISRGCHVLCEKPLAKDTDEARAMLAAANSAGVVHLVGHEFRWSPERAILARAVADGLVGKPKLALFVHYMSLVASPEAKMPRWWFEKEAGGGWLGASGSHLIDQVRTTLGEFASLSAALPMVSAREDGAEDTYVVRFKLTNGIEGTLQQTAAAWGEGVSLTRVAGTHGTVWIEGSTVRIADRNGTRDLPVPPDLVLPAIATEDQAAARRSSALGPYTRLCEALLAAMEGRAGAAAAATPVAGAANVVPAPTFADGVACMEVLDAIRQSAANGGVLVTVR